MRWIALAAGAALIVVAFASATRVADTRDGLIAEVITLFAGLAGVSLLLYGLIGGSRRQAPRAQPRPLPRPPSPSVRPVKDLLLGGGGLAVAVVLLVGLAVSGGPGWAALGSVLLLPMIAGSAYLAVRFVRAPARDWRLDLRRTSGEKES
ncbi:MAG TPA: hypothetical protein VET26_03020 [Candidatus Sulfotelmatobacter sp.]|nr:hypothetical protein [Candidatus Sulfotelmatobacter sp.]